MSRRFYDCIEIVIPKDDGWDGGGCPLGNENCYECEHMVRGGTLGGEVWVECDAVDYDLGDEKEKPQE